MHHFKLGLVRGGRSDEERQGSCAEAIAIHEGIAFY